MMGLRLWFRMDFMVLGVEVRSSIRAFLVNAFQYVDS